MIMVTQIPKIFDDIWGKKAFQLQDTGLHDLHGISRICRHCLKRHSTSSRRRVATSPTAPGAEMAAGADGVVSVKIQGSASW